MFARDHDRTTRGTAKIFCNGRDKFLLAIVRRSSGAVGSRTQCSRKLADKPLEFTWTNSDAVIRVRAGSANSCFRNIEAAHVHAGLADTSLLGPITGVSHAGRAVHH